MFIFVKIEFGMFVLIKMDIGTTELEIRIKSIVTKKLERIKLGQRKDRYTKRYDGSCSIHTYLV